VPSQILITDSGLHCFANPECREINFRGRGIGKYAINQQLTRFTGVLMRSLDKRNSSKIIDFCGLLYHIESELSISL
jgi:hypothetical protein